LQRQPVVLMQQLQTFGGRGAGAHRRQRDDGRLSAAKLGVVGLGQRRPWLYQSQAD
jgi:hypothetical protein